MPVFITEGAGSTMPDQNDVVPWESLKKGVQVMGLVLEGWDPSQELKGGMSREKRRKVMKMFEDGELRFVPVQQS